MRWRRRIERGRTKTVNAIAAATAFVAFAVRLLWTLYVQNPLDALYSDMGAYYSRAVDLIDGAVHGDPRTYAFFPWGAHALIAAELWLVGRSNALGVAFVQSIASTIPAVCVVFLTARVVRSNWWVLIAGFAAAAWQPSVVHAGFFMSEMWYSAFLVPGTLFLLRVLEGKSGAARAGFCLGVATIVRPQVLLTLAIAGGVILLAEVTRARRPIRTWGRFLAPLALILGISAVRFHHYTGHWGLVSENGPINRVFGATHLGRVEAYWNYGGGRFVAWYTPPAKAPVKAQDAVVFEGYVGDEEILDRIRQEHSARENARQHLRRMHRNMQMLIYRNIFPENDFAARAPYGARAILQYGYRAIVVNMVPIGLFGLFGMLVSKRMRIIGFIFLAHFVTLLVVAALYFAEARMRMPYDPFLITAAAGGCSTLYALFGKAHRRVLEWRGRAS